MISEVFKVDDNHTAKLISLSAWAINITLHRIEFESYESSWH
jgi:hypothetical protein